MKNKEGNLNRDYGKLRNYSQVMSHERLTDLDVEIAGGITAGGDKDYLLKDIQDEDTENT